MFLQAAQSEFDFTTVAVWVVAMIGATLLLAVVIVTAKRWMFREEEPSDTIWTLHDLLSLRDSGELTIEQYERLREKLIRQVKTAGAAGRKGENDLSEKPGDTRDGDSDD